MGKNEYISLLVFLAIILAVPLVLKNNYYLSVLVFAALNCLACIGLSLLMGYAGQISLGHAAFICIGAYTSALLTVNLGWSPWVGMFCGIALIVIISGLVAIPTLRLKGHYLAMATLGFGSIVHIIAVAAVDLTGGPLGITSIPNLSFFGIKINNDLKAYYFCWGFAILGLYLAINIINSRVGRALRSIHGSEDAAESLGVNTTRYKTEIFVLSAIYASVSGSLYACYMTYIDPGPFGVMHSILLLTMVAIGGMHKIWGAVLGSLLLTLLPEFLSFLTEYFAFLGIIYKPDYNTLVYGMILLLIMLFLPDGLFQGLINLWSHIQKLFVRLISKRSVNE